MDRGHYKFPIWYAHAQALNPACLTAQSGEAVLIQTQNGAYPPVSALQVLLAPNLAYESLVYTHLSCEENLLLPTTTQHESLGGGLSLNTIYELCPRLHTLRGYPCLSLNKIEQCMLCIARILRTGATVLLFNKLTQHLEANTHATLIALVQKLKELDYTILLTDSHQGFCQAIADRCFSLCYDSLLNNYVAKPISDFKFTPLPWQQAL